MDAFSPSIILILNLIPTIQCHKELVHPLVPEHSDMMFFVLAVWFATVIRLLLIKYNVPTPYELFMLILGLLWGLVVYRNEAALIASQIIHLNPYEFLHVYLPVMIFYNSFCIDVPIFIKTLPQIMVIGFPVLLFTGIMFGLMMRLIIDTEWTLRGGIMFGILCTPIYPNSIVYLLKRQSTLTKQISVLLEGEAILSMITVHAVHNLILNNMLEFVVSWTQILAICLRFIILDPLMGWVFGYVGRYLIRKMYTDNISVFMISFAIPFATFSINSLYFSGFGPLSVAVMGAMMAAERASLSKEVDKFLNDMWETIGFMMDVVVCTTSATLFTGAVAPLLEWADYIVALSVYIIFYAFRFISFLIFSPLLSRLGYGMDLKNMIVCVWSGLKSPLSLILIRQFIVSGLKVERNAGFFFHIFILYFLSLLINGSFTRTALDFLGLRQISLARQMNMINSVKHVLLKRERTIATLKMDRFLADTNWPLVIEATTIKHPYRIELQMGNEYDFFMKHRFTVCPDCQRELAEEPTSKELKEMTKEAKMRILKAKKMSYSRQFANGMMSKEAIRILSQAIELAMDSEAAVIELDGLQKRFQDEGCINRCIRNRVQELKRNKVSALQPPRKYFRRICYYIVVNKTWERFMLVIITIHVVSIILDQIYHPTFNVPDYTPFSKDSPLDCCVAVVELFCSCLYILEFSMKILAYSWIRLANGFRIYFRLPWNWIDLIVMIACFLDSIQNISDLTSSGSHSLLYRQILDAVEFFRVLRLFRLAEIFYPKLIRYLDRNVDAKMAFTYELGRSYATGEAEILDILPFMIDNKKIREEVKEKIETDRVLITKLLGLVQKEKPWIAISVKTKQAIRTVLKSMNEAINQLKLSGWVDTTEHEKLKAGMVELYKKVNAMKTVQPSAPKVIFREVSWMAEEEAVIDFLFENVTVKKFEPGDIVFGEGDVAKGIYIVVTGLFVIKYEPAESMLESLHEFGRLPIVDYLAGAKYEEAAVDYIVSGNCIGELSSLTGRPYNCIIKAEAHSQVYVLSNGILRRAMELSPDPIMGLECRIWKEISIRITVPLLMSVPAYQSFSQDQIKYALERAFVPNLSFYKIFAVTSMIQDIVLIEGVVADYNTKELFVAPICLPRTVQKLILPTSSMLNIPIDIESKLLIIPEKDVDEYDVMTVAEETCEMINTGASVKCLQHKIQSRKMKKVLKEREANKRRKIGDNVFLTPIPSQNTSIGLKESSSLYFQSHTTLDVEDEEEEESKTTYYQK